MSKKISLGAGIALAAISAAVTVSLTYVYAMDSFNEKMADVNERQAMYTKLSEIDQKIRQDYVGEIDEARLTDGICTGYVAGLGDAQAKYYSAQKYREYQTGLAGKSIGVGINTVQDEDGNMEVVEVLPGSAAEKSGVQKGDVIVSLDGKEIVRLTYGEAVNKLDGQTGTTVTLGLLRPAAEEGGEAETITVDITRAEYVQRSITSSVINGNVGYIRISQFRDNTDNQFNTELAALLQSGVSGLVLDVRSNPGGDMEVMANILDTLLPAGTTVRSENKAREVTVEYTSKANEIAVPISVVVNGSTYEAAELFAADIQDYKKGLLVGVQTAGSGDKQEIIPLSDGSAILISVANYLRLNGEPFSGVGISVDVEKELPAEQEQLLARRRLDPAEDVQVQAAVAALVRQGAEVEVSPGEAEPATSGGDNTPAEG